MSCQGTTCHQGRKPCGCLNQRNGGETVDYTPQPVEHEDESALPYAFLVGAIAAVWLLIAVLMVMA